MDQYVYGPEGFPLEQVSGTTVLYFHHDQLGSTRLLTDSNGLVQGAWQFDSYGNATSHFGVMGINLLFTGQYQDAESGLYYLQARYYDPTSAKFLSRDPAMATTRSPYAYVAGNPLNAADPTGQCFTGRRGGRRKRIYGYGLRGHSGYSSHPADINVDDRYVGYLWKRQVDLSYGGLGFGPRLSFHVSNTTTSILPIRVPPQYAS